MKKKILLLAVLVLMSFTGCDSKTSVTEEDTEIQTEKLIDEDKIDSSEDSKRNNSGIISLDERYIGENLELEISGYQWTNLIEPTDKADFYTYYENKNQDTAKYIKIDGIIKSHFLKTVNMEDFAYQVTINDKYTYNLSPTYEEAGDLSILTYIDPLQEIEIILFGEIPNEAIDSIEKITLKFGYNDDHNNMFDSLESRDHVLEFELEEIIDTSANSDIKEETVRNNKPEPKTAKKTTVTDSTNYKGIEVETTTLTNDSSLIGTTTEITAGQANVRSGPGKSYEIIGTAYKGEVVTIYDTFYNEDRTWCQITPYDTAWISVNVINGSIE